MRATITEQSRTEQSRPLWQVRQLVACGADMNITDQVRTADGTCAWWGEDTLCGGAYLTGCSWSHWSSAPGEEDVLLWRVMGLQCLRSGVCDRKA